MVPPDKALAVLKSRWLHYAVLLVLLILAVLWGRAGWRDAGSWETAHNNQKAATIATQKAAEAKALAVKIQTENRYAEIAGEADRLDLSDARARAADYARRMRAEVACHAPRRPAAAAQGEAPPLDNGVPADAVVLTRPEYDLFVEIALDRWRNYEWGQSLIRDGLAEPMPEVALSANVPP
ncbi:hypothetical protein WG901_10120 [Novosphingobium sp. PS1R-30]|uniref:Uncharacterized protein n=1 Tax=Novosphingobium anseongense TaxID=3133436 RepID=A0ABU8RV76_9SPHN